MNPLINTVKELIASKDTDNIKIASEILKKYPTLIDTTITMTNRYGYGNGTGRRFNYNRYPGEESYGDGGNYLYGDGEGNGEGNV